MKTSGNTILITGGGSGIGLEVARLFSAKGNNIILVGRDKVKLENALTQLENATAIICDVTDEEEVNKLLATIRQHHPQANMLFNNAGKAFLQDLSGATGFYEKAKEEIETNFLANIHLTEKLLPLLLQQPEAAIINNTSVSAIVPSLRLATYSASKAAVHFFTQSLRHQLKDTNIKVFELMPPLVDTPFSKELTGDKIPAAIVANDLLRALEADEYEIHTGATAYVYNVLLQSPQKAFELLNGIRG